MMYRSDFPHGLMFHFCHAAPDDKKGQGSLSVEDFERILEFVGTERILTPETWLKKMKDNTLDPDDLCLSFDDGLKCQYDILLPVLEKYNLKAFWFIYSSVLEGKIGKLDLYSYFRAGYFDHIDEFYDLFLTCAEENGVPFKPDQFDLYRKRIHVKFPFYSLNDMKFRFLRDEVCGPGVFESIMDELILARDLSIEQIAQDLWLTEVDLADLAKQGHTIGLHSYDHPATLCRLPDSEQEAQYRRNYEHLRKITGQDITAVAHPCNSYNEHTLNLLKEMGITCGFLSNMHISGLNGKNVSPLEMAREDCTNILRMLNSQTNQFKVKGAC